MKTKFQIEKETDEGRILDMTLFVMDTNPQLSSKEAEKRAKFLISVNDLPK